MGSETERRALTTRAREDQGRRERDKSITPLECTQGHEGHGNEIGNEILSDACRLF